MRPHDQQRFAKLIAAILRHRVLPFGSLVIWSAASRSVTSQFAAGQYDRIVKPLIP
jgi:hypothetical protein